MEQRHYTWTEQWEPILQRLKLAMELNQSIQIDAEGCGALVRIVEEMCNLLDNQ